MCPWGAIEGVSPGKATGDHSREDLEIQTEVASWGRILLNAPPPQVIWTLSGKIYQLTLQSPVQALALTFLC